MNEMVEYLDAGYSHFYVHSDEINLAVEFIQNNIKEHSDEFTTEVWSYTAEEADPLAPLIDLENKKNVALILKNYNWFLHKDPIARDPNPEVVQFIQDNLELYRSAEKRIILIILSNVSFEKAIPRELSRDFIKIEHALPDEKEIEQILDNTIDVAKRSNQGESKIKNVTPAVKKQLINNSLGMTRFEVQNSYFLSLVRTKELDPNVITELRTAFLESVAGVKYIQYEETFATLKGYEVVKELAERIIPNPMAKGMMLLGPTGTGKSHFGKACSGEFGIPMLTVEMAEWQGGIVGDTEENVRKAIEAIKAFKRVIVFVDEIEKGFEGIGGNRTNTSDTVTARAMSQFLKFMQDRPDGIYFIATCNDISKVPPEYLRAERWDTAPFFIDLPLPNERKEILDFYKKVYNVKGDLTDNETEGWTGSEIKTICRLTKILNEAKKKGETKHEINNLKELIVPISVTKEVEIKLLREWASGRTLPASRESADSKGFSTRNLRYLKF